MTGYRQAQKTIEHKVSACEEQVDLWKVDHDFAILVFDCEDLAVDGIKLYANIDKLNKSYTVSVCRNPDSYDPELDDDLKKLYRSWIELAENILSQCDRCVSLGHQVKGQAELAAVFANAIAAKEVDFEHHAIAMQTIISPTMAEFEKIATPMESWPD